jgi:ribonuclease BN (tRNA processing enzyme)
MIDENSAKLLARYAIAGCGGDVWSRAAADQRFKLADVRAVFCSTTSNSMLLELSMLPALLLATSNSEQLTIVSPQADVNRIEELIQLLHGNKQHPSVRICSLPSPPSQKEHSSKQDINNNNNPWWKVYEDEHIMVHGRYHFWNQQPSPIMIYIYTFRCLLLLGHSDHNKGQKNSILIILETARWDEMTTTTHIQNQLQSVTTCDLPIIITTGVGMEKQTEYCVTLLTRIWIQKEELQSILSPSLSGDWHVLVTPALRKDRCCSIVDPGLLLRAQQQTRMWRDHCDKARIPYFPFKEQNSDLDTCRYEGSNRHWSLLTGTSIVFHSLQPNSQLSVLTVNRHEQRKNQQQQEQCDIFNETKEPTPSSENDCGREAWPNKLAPFLHYRTKSRFDETSCHHDENEIDIDDDDPSDIDPLNEELPHHDDVYNFPYILVLGTGCAAPSPYRGASGYALVLPISKDSHGTDAFVVAIDPGEGFCTQWNRYAGNVNLSSIQVIWISHAHWDHYGGVVNLLQLIHKETSMYQSKPVDSNRTFKRPRVSSSPFVVAPKKVLAFLRILLCDMADKYYRAVSSDDTRSVDAIFSSINLTHKPTGNLGHETSFSPFLFWENVRVDHSCYQSYGFVFGLKEPMMDNSGSLFYTGAPIIVSYSGDTRPSSNLVRSCRRRMAQYSRRLDLLIHEATFDESRKEMALEKKHTTVQEAIQVGQDLDSRRLLLTHFSQRYCRFDHISEHMKYNEIMQIGFALDGIIIRL